MEEYKYLGMMMQKRGWKKYKEKMLRSARRAMMWSWNLLTKTGDMTVKGMVSVWSTLIRPYLEYGAEVWCSEDDCVWPEAEAIQRKMARRILGSSRSTANEVVLGELGWSSLKSRRMMLRLFFWHKLLRMGEDRWVKRVYEASRSRAEADPEVKNWCSLTRQWLRDLDLEDAWTSQKTGPEWRGMVRDKVFQLEQRQWRQRMEAKPKLHCYRLWKLELTLEGYLSQKDVAARRALTRVRSGTCELREETGRWESLGGGLGLMRRDERRCELCFSEVEDATHLLLRCPAYAQLRIPALQALEAEPQEQGVVDHARALRLTPGQDPLIPRDLEVETRMLQWLTDEEPELIMTQLRKSLTRRKWLRGITREEVASDSGSDSDDEDYSEADSEADREG